MGVAQLLGPHKVKFTGKDGTKEFTADHIILATGARARSLPGADFDGKLIISSREAMILPQLPKRLAVIGAGAIGCEFADFYSALGTEGELSTRSQSLSMSRKRFSGPSLCRGNIRIS